MDENEIDRIIVGAAVTKEGMTRSINGLDDGT